MHVWLRRIPFLVQMYIQLAGILSYIHRSWLPGVDSVTHTLPSPMHAHRGAPPSCRRVVPAAGRPASGAASRRGSSESDSPGCSGSLESVPMTLKFNLKQRMSARSTPDGDPVRPGPRSRMTRVDSHGPSTAAADLTQPDDVSEGRPGQTHSEHRGHGWWPTRAATEDDGRRWRRGRRRARTWGWRSLQRWLADSD
jgi:hypothetical protein